VPFGISYKKRRILSWAVYGYIKLPEGEAKTPSYVMFLSILRAIHFQPLWLELVFQTL